MTPSGPLGYGPHLTFLEVAPGGAQRVRVVAWDGTAWVNWPVQFPAIPAGTRAEDPVRVVLSTDRLRAWVHVQSARAGLRAYAWSVDAPGAWTGAPLLLDPQGGTVRADAVAVRYANDGRPPTTAITLTRPDGQAEVRDLPDDLRGGLPLARARGRRAAPGHRPRRLGHDRCLDGQRRHRTRPDADPLIPGRGAV